jgi:protein MpaA
MILTHPRAVLSALLVALTVLAVGPAALLGVPGAAGAPVRAAPAVPAADTTEPPPTVVGVRRIGTSVQDRPIRAFRLGDPKATVKAVVLGAMHGNEKAGITVAHALRKGPPVQGIDLWVVPTMNPDGVAANTRGNARGVDLNRNFRRKWAPLTGAYYSGTKPFSEPESRAFRDFVRKIQPRFIVSFHQPLYGVGRSQDRKPFQRRLARNLGLPIKSFNCSGTCHGTMTSWYNHNFDGTAITVEFGSSPTKKYLRGKARRGTVRAVLGSY